MDLLKFITCGSVDDGKSTLIGRLLYDTGSVYEDQLEAIARETKGGDGAPDLAILTDGLKAEREQGITIDVAYKYFATAKRKFIIADAPGHVQYTRNMVTGASNANLAIILIDARKGVIEQTCRHSYIASLLGIPHLLVCINKMDLVGFEKARFDAIVADFGRFSAQLQIPDIAYMPISALNGDNIVAPSGHMPWYTGPTLLQHLEEVPLTADENLTLSRLPVQYVIRPQTTELHDYRGYAGRIASGIFRTGDPVTVLPSGLQSTITRMHTAEQELQEAFAPMSVSMLLAHDLDISRGDTLVRTEQPTQLADHLAATLCWMGEQPLQAGSRYLLQHHSRRVKCQVLAIDHRTDVNTLCSSPAEQFGLNDIGQVQLRLAAPLAFDAYSQNRAMGGCILIDERTNATVAAGMLLTLSEPAL